MNNEQNMTQNIDQTAAEQANAAQTAAEQKLAKKKLTRRIFIGGGLGALAVAGGGAGWAYNRYLAEHTENRRHHRLRGGSSSGKRKRLRLRHRRPHQLTGVKVNGQSLTANEGSITITSNTTGSGSDAVVSVVADIKLDNATLLRSAFANNKFGQNIIDTPSNIASEHNGIWAINGDYYGFRTTGIVIRNGVVYRDAGAREGLAFYRDGSVKLYDETATNAQTLVNEGVWNTLSFGPALVKDSAIVDGIDSVEVDTNFGNHSIQGYQPRTGVGVLGTNHLVFIVLGTNHLVFIVVDGRSTNYSRGVTIPEFAQMFKDLGCVSAYNLDGGGSSTMVFNNKLVNRPQGGTKERGTSDILYIAGSAS